MDDRLYTVAVHTGQPWSIVSRPTYQMGRANSCRKSMPCDHAGGRVLLSRSCAFVVYFSTSSFPTPVPSFLPSFLSLARERLHRLSILIGRGIRETKDRRGRGDKGRLEIRYGRHPATPPFFPPFQSESSTVLYCMTSGGNEVGDVGLQLASMFRTLWLSFFPPSFFLFSFSLLPFFFLSS